MASTEQMPSRHQEDAEKASSGPRRFVASSTALQAPEPEPTPSLRERVQGLVHSTHPTVRTVIIAAAGLSALGVVVTMAATETAQPAQATIDAYQQALSEQEDAEMATSRLEAIKDPQAQIENASSVAEQIVVLQSAAARDTAAIDEASSMDAQEAEEVSRQMQPYFSTDVDPESLGPWYLVAADVDADAGVGFGSGFDSTVTWRVDSASTIDESGKVPVRFSAYDSDSLDEQDPVLLAWATADFDPRSDTMEDLVTGVTAEGQAAQLKVGA